MERFFQKLKHYCAYQERCHQEVKDKSYSLGLRKQEVEALTARLIEEGYLNEERFAIQFAGGKFRMNQWGKIKIRHALKLKKVSDYCIRKALASIDEEAYQDQLTRLARKKWNATRSVGANLFVKMAKTRNYLLQKGYEPNLINAAIEGLKN